MEKSIKQILEKQDWWITKIDDGWMLSKYSPLGEDFSICVSNAHMAEDIIYEAESYDVDRHAQIIWHFAKGVDRPRSFTKIADDARAIGKMLDELSSAIKEKFPELCEPVGSEIDGVSPKEED